MSRVRTAIAVGIALVVGGALLAWLPGPIRPLAWSPPPGMALEGQLGVDRELLRTERIAEGLLPGPEDVAVDPTGRLYCGVEDGTVRRLTEGREGWEVEIFAETGGRPLGLDLGADGVLWVADTELGLLSIDPRGGVRTWLEAAGPLRFANDVDAGPDGTVYFTDASSFAPAAIHLDTLEARPHGRLLRYTPARRRVEVLLDDLYFANGVALADDRSYVLVAETFRYRVRRYWLTGGRAGESEVLIDRLPGFPDGISADGRGGFWLALFTLRSAALDRWVHPRPWLKRLLGRLPAPLLAGVEPYGLVVALDADGRITGSLHDPGGGRFASVTSVEEHAGHLYLGTTEGTAIGRYRLR